MNKSNYVIKFWSVLLLVLVLCQPIAFAAMFSNPYTSVEEYRKDISDDKGVREINEYVTDVSSFIQNKCNGCENVIIVGSDYVVPQYRNEITYGKNLPFGWGFSKETNLLTDSKFISNTYNDGSIADFKSYLIGTGITDTPRAKDVVFILPSNWTQTNSHFVKFRGVLDMLHITGQIFYDGKIYNSDELTCDSFSQLEDSTLFIIGNKTNNRIFNCYSNSKYDNTEGLIALDRNIWSENDKAFLIDDDILDDFSIIIQNGEYVALKGIYYQLFKFNNNARYFFEKVPYVGDVLSFIVVDMASDNYVNIGDICSYSIKKDDGILGMICGAMILLEAEGGAGLTPFKKSVIKKGIEEAGEKEALSLSEKILMIDKSVYSKELNQFFYKDLVSEPQLWSKAELELLEKRVKREGVQVLTSEAGEKQILRIFKSEIDGVPNEIILRKGNIYKGWIHLKNRHIGSNAESNNIFKFDNGVEMNENQVKNLISEALEKGYINDAVNTDKSGKSIVIVYEKNTLSKSSVRVVVDKDSKEIITSYLSNRVS